MSVAFGLAVPALLASAQLADVTTNQADLNGSPSLVACARLGSALLLGLLHIKDPARSLPVRGGDLAVYCRVIICLS